MKIIDYKIIDDTYPFNLSVKARKEIKKGWQPFGGVFEDNQNVYIQAMVKYEDEGKCRYFSDDEDEEDEPTSKSTLRGLKRELEKSERLKKGAYASYEKVMNNNSELQEEIRRLTALAGKNGS